MARLSNVLGLLGLIRLQCDPSHVTFNHGVEGSSPSALTKENKHLAEISSSSKKPCVCTVSANALRAPERVMSDEFDWDFSGQDDAKAGIRAAVRYLLEGAAGSDRGDIVQEIIAIVRQVASGLPPEQPNPLDDDLPGG
jgi:hypothetical protein